MTEEKKRAVVDRLLAAWLIVPEMRLGQLIANATEDEPFFPEDEKLAELCEAFAKGNRNK